MFFKNILKTIDIDTDNNIDLNCLTYIYDYIKKQYQTISQDKSIQKQINKLTKKKNTREKFLNNPFISENTLETINNLQYMYECSIHYNSNTINITLFFNGSQKYNKNINRYKSKTRGNPKSTFKNYQHTAFSSRKPACCRSNYEKC